MDIDFFRRTKGKGARKDLDVVGKELERKAASTTWNSLMTLRTWPTTQKAVATPKDARVTLHAPGLQRGTEKVLTYNLKEEATELDAKDPFLIALAAAELGTLLINATPLRTVRA